MEVEFHHAIDMGLPPPTFNPLATPATFRRETAYLQGLTGHSLPVLDVQCAQYPNAH